MTKDQRFWLGASAIVAAAFMIHTIVGLLMTGAVFLAIGYGAHLVAEEEKLKEKQPESK